MIAAILARLLKLSRHQKRFILVSADIVLLNFALWLAMTVRWGYLYVAPTWTVFVLLATVPVLAATAFYFADLYSHVTRHFGATGTQLMAVCISLSAVGLGVGAFLTGTEGIPRSVLFLYPLFGTLAVWGSRFALQELLAFTGIHRAPAPLPGRALNVMIYGTGQDGRALLEAIRRSRDLVAVGFVDPDQTLWRQFVDGVRVYSPQQLAATVQALDVKHVLLATNHASRTERMEALRWLENCPVEVRALPAVEDIASGRVSVSDLRRVEADDLLGRPPVPPDPALMARAIGGKCVLVTGAGGSIGAELVRQILRYEPRRLVMFDASEANLFVIGMHVDGELQRQKRTIPGRPVTEIVSILGSVNNADLVQATIRSHGVQAIYHAAAFKHVPILEQNAIEGMRNNVLGTEIVANAAESCGVERFVFVSTDKAVRPSSTMGASKRVAEMLLQARASVAGTPTVFAIVRFGNVLDSSGSVVPLFRRQIETGGPVTVTHPDMVRYFISIPEAAALVIQAGTMAKGGEVFFLDMGEPVHVVDLARLMIKLSGRQLRDAETPDGDIEIVFTGIRPGEKLVEEVHLSPHTKATEHPRIMRIDEPHLPPDEFAAHLEVLRTAMQKYDVAGLREGLARLVEGYNSHIDG